MMDHAISLKGYLDANGKFERLPGKKQKKKLDLMLTALASPFQKDLKYTEQEVNKILNKQHSFNDPATLRRLLIGTNILGRSTDGRSYWLKEKS